MESIGILLIDSKAPHIPGSTGNAKTYSFPIRLQKIEGLTVERALNKDLTIFDSLLQAAKELQSQKVRAITSDCGFLAIHQKKLANCLEIPVFLSSLLQIPFIISLLGDYERLGILTADSQSFDASLLKAVGVESTVRLTIRGLENQENFSKSILKESGILDSEKIEEEVVSVAEQMILEEPAIKAILLECAGFPPYAAAVQKALNLPVFDFVTMINFVYSAVAKRDLRD